jgi:hypothetical protein
MMNNQRQNIVQPFRQPVTCRCGHVIYDGDVIKSRCVKVLVMGAQALCKCKSWVVVPITYKH